MSENNLSQILTSIPTLSYGELQLVQQEITRLLEGKASGGQPAATDKSEEEMRLFYIVSTTVMSEHGLRPSPWGRFRQTKVFKSLKSGFPEVQSYTEKHFGSVRRQKRQSLYRIYAELLVKWMQDRPKVPMKPGTFFQNLGQIPALIADAFPGYAEQGWLPMILDLGSRDHRNPPMEE